ncbi:TPA: HNH endonuclease signature motif containing protein [Vibrio cholerae]|nr:putative homing endonuclease [Vibrio phage ICP1]QVV97659.1 putative homing endonuclease [Vibrio phage ICP1]QVV97886.1 putative homing endonuclease [Vibrio phage ICP1]QVV98113.1 putative homing endonuclease [Vibrio phage ICP1]QVV98794.1 putative homing endonuclease [Vibrio phage ICP1]
MNYEKIYYNLCNSRKYRGCEKEQDFEVHHILPRCLGGGDNIDNLVKFTPKEHYFAHKLLLKFVAPKHKAAMQSALNILSWALSLRDKYRPWEHAEACEQISRVVLFKYTELFKKNKTGLISISRNNKNVKIVYNKDKMLNLLSELQTSYNKNNIYYLEALCSEVLDKLNSYNSFAIFKGYSPHRLWVKDALVKLERLGYINVLLDKKYVPTVFVCTDKFKSFILSLDFSKRTGNFDYNFTSNNKLLGGQIKLAQRYPDLFFCEVSKYRFKIYPRKLWTIEDYNDNMQMLFALPEAISNGSSGGKMVYTGTIEDLDKALFGTDKNCRIVREA